MNEERRSVGFFRSVGRTPVGSLLWPEGALALVLGIGGGICILNVTKVPERISVVGDTLAILGVLLGVVFAAFALLIALFSDEYVRLLEHAEGGVIVFLRPFMISIGCQVTTIFLSIGYRATAIHLDSRVEVGVFLAWAFLFVFVIADIVALTRNIMLHGLHRARLTKAKDEETSVRQIRDKTS